MKQPFDFSPYEFTLTDPVMSLDRSHIQMLYLCAVVAPVGVAVEVGSGHGASTSALVQAVIDGHLTRVHSVEPNANKPLMSVLERASPGGKATWTGGPYHDTPPLGETLVFIDGDHGWHALADTLTALARGAAVIAMHDTATEDTWGSHLAAGILRQAEGRIWFEDAGRRDGGLTHRGFFVSARNGIDITPLDDYRKSL